MVANSFGYPFNRSNNYLGAYRLLPSTKAALPIMEDMQFDLVASAPSISATQTLAPITQSSTLAAIGAFSASQTLGSLTQTATLALVGSVTASQTLDTITQAATLTTSVAALSLTASQTLGDITQTATLANVAALAASQTIGSLTQSASLANVASLTASQSIGGISQTATFAGVTAALNISAAQTLDAITQSATLSANSETAIVSPGTDVWPAPSGWYDRKRKPQAKPVKEEIEEAAREVTEIVSRENFRVTPQQLSRMASALVRRTETPSIDLDGIAAQVENLKADLKAVLDGERDRKEIERKASEVVALLAYLVDLQSREDDDLLLLLAA